MNKELKFSMKFDTGEFDRAVEKMQQKLKEIAGLSKGPQGQQPQGGAGGGSGGDAMLSKPGMEAFFKSMQALRSNMDNAMRNHAKEQMKLMKDISKEEERRGKLLQDQEKIAKGKTRDLQEELRIKKELKTTEEQISRLTGEAGRRRTSFDAARGAAMGGTQPVFVTNWPSGRGGGGEGDGGGGGGGKSPKSFMSGLGKTLGTAAALLATGATLIDQYTSLPLTRSGALGNATQSIVGGNLQEIANGNVVPAMAWQREKQRAMKYSQNKMQSDQVTDSMDLLGGGMNLITGGAVGSDRSANMLVGGVAKAMSDVLSVSMKGSIADKLSISLGRASQEYFTAHQAQLMEDFGKNYESMLSAQQKQNPLKNLAVNYLQDRYKTDMQAQRMMGLTDDEFYGRKGFMEQGNMAGFSGDMMMQSAQQIQAAGGSTRSMKGNSLLALKAQRGLDLTNAGSVLGTISGGAGGAEASERIFKKILEEGVKNGLDKSEAVEELRRFSQQTAEVVSKTGATSEVDAQRIIESFSRFQAGGIPTGREAEGAKAAYQEYQNQSAATSGRGGAMQYSSMIKGGLADKFDPRQIGDMMEMPEEDVHTGNPFIQAMASKAGMRPEELVRQIINNKRTGVQAASGVNPAWQKILQKANITKELGPEELEKLKNENPEAYDAYIQIESAAGNVSQYGGMQKRSAVVRGMMTQGQLEPGEEPTGTTAEGARVEGALEEQPGTRAADEVVRSAGVAAQAMLENFRDFKTEITPAADALDIFTKRLVILTQVMGMTPEGDRAAAARYVGEKLFTPVNQQAGKPKAGQRNASGDF